MNVHFISTRKGWRVVETLIDATPEEVEKARARLLKSHDSIAIWYSHDSAEAIDTRLRSRQKARR